MRNAFNRDHYRIIVSYRYHDNFDSSYRLSIKNSIWHIVTALYTNATLPEIILQKCSKMQYIFLVITDSAEGLLQRNWHDLIALVEPTLSTNWHVTATTYRLRDICGQMAQNPTPSPFFWSRIWWPLKISPPKWEKLCLSDRSTITHTFTPIGDTSAKISVPNHKHTKNYSTFNIRQNAY